MQPDTAGLAVIRDAEDARRAITSYRRYPKLLSWLVLRSAGLPALTGVIVMRWNKEVASGIALFASELGSNRLLVRSDSVTESGHAPRGGYVVTLDQLEAVVCGLLDRGRSVFLLEPASPFDDLYSWSLEPD